MHALDGIMCVCNVQYELAWDYIFFWNIPRLCRSIQEFMKSTNFLALNRFSIYDNWMPLRIFFFHFLTKLFTELISLLKRQQKLKEFTRTCFLLLLPRYTISLSVCFCRREKEKLAVIFHVTVQSFCSCWLCKRNAVKVISEHSNIKWNSVQCCTCFIYKQT